MVTPVQRLFQRGQIRCRRPILQQFNAVRELHHADFIVREQPPYKALARLAYELHLTEHAARSVQQKNYVGRDTLAVEASDLLANAVVEDDELILAQPAHGRARNVPD